MGPTLPLLIIDELELVVGAGQAVLTRGWPVLRRREQQVHAQLQRVIQHPWDHSLQHQAGGFDAGVSVYLNQPWLELPVDHEVQPEHLKDSACWLAARDQVHRCPQRVGSHLFHFGHHLRLQVVAAARVSRVQVALELVIGELISLLVLPIALRVVLHCVIGQVHEAVEIVELELEGASADVPLFIPVPLH